jgi:predicted nucleic acid-binding protein
MIAVDTTVLADFWVGEDSLRTAAHRLLTDDPEWIAAGLWRYELGSTLLKYVRAGRLPMAIVEEALEKTPELLSETIDDLELTEVLAISNSYRLSYYDAAHVWVARSRGVPLYTRDSGILKAVPEVARSASSVS